VNEIETDTQRFLEFPNYSDAFGDAIEATGRSFQTGGNAPWVVSYSEYYQGYSSVASGNIGNNEISELNTTIAGPGIIEFYWKVSSEQDYDKLKFYMNSTLIDEISGNVNWTKKTFQVNESKTYIFRWVYEKDYVTSALLDKAWIDTLSWTQLNQNSLALDSQLNFTITSTGFSDQWEIYNFGAQNGSSCLRAQPGISWSTTASTTISEKGILSFYWKKSSSSSSNSLNFEVSGYISNSCSSISWTKSSYVKKTAYAETFSWRFQQGEANAYGYLDNVQFIPCTPVTISTYSSEIQKGNTITLTIAGQIGKIYKIELYQIIGSTNWNLVSTIDSAYLLTSTQKSYSYTIPSSLAAGNYAFKITQNDLVENFEFTTSIYVSEASSITDFVPIIIAVIAVIGIVIAVASLAKKNINVDPFSNIKDGNQTPLPVYDNKTPIKQTKQYRPIPIRVFSQKKVASKEMKKVQPISVKRK
jgi:hypothetical protein